HTVGGQYLRQALFNRCDSRLINMDHLAGHGVKRLIGLFIQTRKKFRAKGGLFHCLCLSEPVSLIDDVMQWLPLVETLAIFEEDLSETFVRVGSTAGHMRCEYHTRHGPERVIRR